MNSTTSTLAREQPLLSANEIAQLPADEVYTYLATSPDGLTADEVVARLGTFGHNQYEPPPRRRRFLAPLLVAVRPLLLPLWIAAALAFALGLPQTATVLLIAAIANTVAGIVQERKRERAAAALRTALPGYAHVVREGRDHHIVSSQVVPGDVLLLHGGEIIPADARVVEEQDLRTVNVALMGEAGATRKVAAAVMGDDLLATETPNLVYAGARIASGAGRAVVYATGLKTAYGQIVVLTETAHEEPSPLLWVFTRLGLIVMLVATVAAGIAALLMRAQTSAAGIDDRQIVLVVIGFLTAAVPVGLMPGITVTLLEGWRRLGRHRAHVRRLSSIETLGATTVICADKTGTLTQNEMTVRELWTADGVLTVSGIGFDPHGNFASDGRTLDPAMVKRKAGSLLRAAVLTSAARLLPPDTLQPQWHILGDQVEAAAIVAAAKAGYQSGELYENAPQVVTLPASDALALEGRIVEERDCFVAYLKGTPAALLPRCTSIATADGERPLNDHDRQALRRALRRYERGAMRTIAFARRPLPAATAHGASQTEQVAHDLTLLGVIAALDPPRHDVEEAIRACHRAGIRTMMLTGDYLLGAESVARRCALVESSRATTITGIELSEMDDATLRERLRVGDIVFARMTPEHKVRVVETLDAMGEVVLVTGGAANDVPAIKAADIGVAMGSSSSVAVREAADLILQDNNFATIAHAIAEGRAVEQRARRLVALNLAATVVKLVAYIATLLLGWPLLLTVGQLLLIDLLGGFLPAIALGAGPPDPFGMQRRPRPSGRSLIDGRILRIGYGWFALLGSTAALVAAVGMMMSLGIPLAGVRTLMDLPIGDQLSNSDNLQITTAYVATGIAALVGAGLRLRSSTRRYPLGRALLAMVLIAVASTLVALTRLPTFQPFVELSSPPPWLWAGAAGAMVVASLLEWGRQQIDRIPK